MFSVTLKKKDNRLPRVLALRMFYRQRFFVLLYGGHAINVAYGRERNLIALFPGF